MSLNYGRGRVGGDDYKFSDRRREHREVRSPEALERRREERLDRNPFAKPPKPTLVSITPLPAPSPPPDDLLLDAERRLEFGARVTVKAFVDDVGPALRVSFEVAAAVVNELIRQGRLVRNVASNGFTTLSRPTGKAAHQKRSK
jgi:hypothetical protein